MPPETFTIALSMPMPLSAAMQCSTVSTNSVPLRRHVRRGRFGTFWTQRRDGRDAFALLADERDPAVGLGGRERQRRRLAGEQPGPGDGHLARNCPL